MLFKRSRKRPLKSRTIFFWGDCVQNFRLSVRGDQSWIISNTRKTHSLFSNIWTHLERRVLSYAPTYLSFVSFFFSRNVRIFLVVWTKTCQGLRGVIPNESQHIIYINFLLTILGTFSFIEQTFQGFLRMKKCKMLTTGQRTKKGKVRRQI